MTTQASAKRKPPAPKQGPAREGFTKLDDGTITDRYFHDDPDITDESLELAKQFKTRHA